YVRADADSEVAAFLPVFRLLPPKVFVCDMVDQLLKRAGVVAAVVREASRDGVPVFELRNEVLLTEIDRVHSEFGSQHVDQTFQNERGLRTARAAIRFDGRAVGVDAVDVFPERRTVVGPRQ